MSIIKPWDRHIIPSGLSHVQAWSQLLGLELCDYIPEHVTEFHEHEACAHDESSAIRALRVYAEHPGSALVDHRHVYALCLSGPQACDYVRTNPILRLCCGLALPGTDVETLLERRPLGEPTDARTMNQAPRKVWSHPQLRSAILAQVASGALAYEGLNDVSDWYCDKPSRGGALCKLWMRGRYAFMLLACAQMHEARHEGERAHDYFKLVRGHTNWGDRDDLVAACYAPHYGTEQPRGMLWAGLVNILAPKVRDPKKSEMMSWWFSTWCVGILDQMRHQSVDTPPWLSWGSVARTAINAMPKLFSAQGT